MQASIDSLDRGRNAEAPPAMAEALKHLVAARRELAILIGERLRPGRRDAGLRPQAGPEDPQAQEQGRGGRGDRRPARRTGPGGRIRLRHHRRPSMGGTAAAEAKGKPKGKPPSRRTPKKDRAQGGGREDQGKAPRPRKAAAKAKEQGKEAQAGRRARRARKARVERQGRGQGQGDEGEGGPGEPKKLDRRAVAEKQEEIADEVRDLEEKLKRLEAASDLAKARMARAAEKVEKASGDLARGNTKEAAEDAKAGAGMLHELARQVKGEIAREAADELAMARDLAEELADREAELADRKRRPIPSGQPGRARSQGKDRAKERERRSRQGRRQGRERRRRARKGGRQGREGRAGRAARAEAGRGRAAAAGTRLTEAEQIDRMAEMARTLEAWLKQIDKRGEGKAADAVGEILDKGNVAEIVERAERMGELRVGGKKDELGREARELAARLEVLGQALELLHRGIVAPQLAAMVEFDRRVAELTARLGTTSRPRPRSPPGSARSPP